jgi:ribulose kinase
MCDELCSLYECFPKKGARIVASGGAVRKNEILKRLIEDTFGMSAVVSEIKEDAAKGAALFCRRG